MASKALFVGTNKYPGCPLFGCVDDARDFAKFVLSHKFFVCWRVKVLTEEETTTKNLLKWFRWVSDVSPKDAVLVHTSGHGVQVDDPNEEDKMAEAICPIDFDWTPEHMITDDQMVQIFSAIPHGARFNWSADSCHSGTLDSTRAFRMRHPNGRNYPLSAPPAGHAARPLKPLRTRNAKVEAAGLDVGFVSACRANQTAADANINGHPCGAFTHYFLEALAQNLDKPLTDIADRTHVMLHAAGYEQDPTVSGTRANRPFLL